MLETLIFQCSIAIAHKFDNFTNISKRLWDLVYVWSVLLSLKFQTNSYSFERVVTLFVGYYFSSGHRVYTIDIIIILYLWYILKNLKCSRTHGFKTQSRAYLTSIMDLNASNAFVEVPRKSH